jgi:hypothetical protein
VSPSDYDVAIRTSFDPLRSLGRLLAAIAACACLLAVAPSRARAVVTQTAASNIPYVDVNGTGDSYARHADTIGSTVYVGGALMKIFAPASKQSFTRPGLVAFDVSTGAVSSFAPSFNGTVWGLAHSPDGRYLYVAGGFTTVNGVSRRGLVRFDLSTGRVDTGFDARLNGAARAVAYVGGRLIVGGTFSAAGGVRRVGLASLEPVSGALTSYVDANLAGTVSSSAGATGVTHMATNAAGTQMALSGNFTSAGGATHWRVFLLDLGGTTATVDAWNAPTLQQPCNSTKIPNYVSGLSFAGDGSWLAISATGFRNSGKPLTSSICDAVSRFSTAANPSAVAQWVNYTGCDSLYGVLVTPTAVYVTGHNRWLDNPNACDSAGTGAVSRPGIGAVSPSTGKALAWNPTRSRGRGGDYLLMTARGLLVLSDCAAPGISGDPSSGANALAKTYHPCIGLLPGS